MLLKTNSLPISISQIWIRNAFLGLASLSFVVPFALGHSQITTGILVNAALFISATLLPSKFIWPLVFLPSLAVLSRGVVFGPLTPFLIYFLPFIWLGNFSLIIIFKKAFSSFGFLSSILLASVIKTVILFSFANLFLKLGLVPALFLSTMGLNQFLTACLGGILAFSFFKFTSHGKI